MEKGWGSEKGLMGYMECDIYCKRKQKLVDIARKHGKEYK